MKKIFLMVAVAAAMMTGCSKNETVEQPAGRAIQFSNTVVAKAASSLNAGQFNIFGYKNTTLEFTDIYNLYTDFYKRGNASADPDDWRGMYYYDGVNPYSFYGYAKTNQTTFVDTNTKPSAFDANVTVTAVTTAGSEKITFVTPNNNNTDLVTMAVGPIPVALQTQNYLVTFKHALTRVRFTAYSETVDPDRDIVITGLTFKTATNTGEVAWADMANGEMTAVSGAEATFALSGNFQAKLDGTVLTPVTTTNDVFYVVPQALRNGDLVVNYTVGGVPDSKTFNLSTALAGAPIVLASGQSYNFNIKINLNKITFDAQLEDWAEVTPPVYL